MAMQMQLLKAFAVLVFVSLQASGEDKIMVCKDMQSLFTDADNQRFWNKINRIHGPPGRSCSVGAGRGGSLPASSFTASSQWDIRHGPQLARLYGTEEGRDSGSWSSRPSAVGQWIQVDLGRVTTVVGVMTQGRPSTIYLQWVTSFQLLCGLTESSFHPISHENGTAKIFIGNTDTNTVVTNVFPHEECRFLRIYPQTAHDHMTMRVDFLKAC